MKPGSFDYVCPTSLEEALRAIAEHGNAKLLAGGQSLIPMMNFRVASPELLIDLNRVQGWHMFESVMMPSPSAQ